jgi:hypothetical protein
MTHSDKILQFLKEKPAASTSEIRKYLEGKGVNVTQRTVQRDLRELADQHLIQGHAIGREVVYSLITGKSTTINDYLESKYWEKLFEINDDINHFGFASMRDFSKLRNLVLLLPDKIKEQIIPLLRNLASKEGFLKDRSLPQKEFMEIISKTASLLHQETDSC